MARAAGAQVVGAGVDRRSQRRRASRFDVPFTSLLDDRRCRPTSRSSARCAPQGLPVVKPGSRPVVRDDAPMDVDLQAHARLRRHRLRRLAASGQRRVDSGLLEEALRGARRPARSTVAGAGRTDAGVHALGPGGVVHARTRRSTPATLRARAQRQAAAGDPRARRRRRRRQAFIARFDAPREDLPLPHLERRGHEPVRAPLRWHVPGAARRRRMGAAARLLVGRHDFAAFQAAGARRRATASARIAFESRAATAGRPRRCATASPAAATLVYEVRGTRLPAAHGPHHRRHAGRDRARPARPRRGWREVLASRRSRRAAGPTAPAARAVSGRRRLRSDLRQV